MTKTKNIYIYNTIAQFQLIVVNRIKGASQVGNSCFVPKFRIHLVPYVHSELSVSNGKCTVIGNRWIIYNTVALGNEDQIKEHIRLTLTRADTKLSEAQAQVKFYLPKGQAHLPEKFN